MSTRSRIAMEDNETGKVRSIYCHFDGYPSGVGATLLQHYKAADKVEALIALGDISVLGEEIGEKQDFDAREQHNPSWTLAYGRDRGEEGVDAATDDDAEAVYARATEGWEEFVYLFRQGVWLVTEVGGGAGPFLVNANDPNGERESRWQRVEAALAAEAEAEGRSYAIV